MLRYPKFPLSRKDANGNDVCAHCRALGFNPDFLGAGKQKLLDRNVFIKNIPQEMTCAELHSAFEKYGDITSAKISLDQNHQNIGYGFVCFANPDSAKYAI
mmetsp:Transcript_30594/g.30057  ORF Transcript_30594/g.30057 Transcript_30594/m.30057 type:complete len:101 (+) Transcript_30594:276-578(+)